MGRIKSFFVEKKPGHDIEAKKLYSDIKNNLNINSLTDVRIINRYDIECLDDSVEQSLELCKNTIFSEPPLDSIADENICIGEDERIFAYKYLPGQYDQRADSAEQCVRVVTGKTPVIETAKIIICTGKISDGELTGIKSYVINPVDSSETSVDTPKELGIKSEKPKKILPLGGFIDMDDRNVREFRDNYGLAMTERDLLHCLKYFRDEEKRNPTLTEIKVLDTYWSDHCRHTTFLTGIEKVEFEEGYYTELIKETYEMYLSEREKVYGKASDRAVSLMDIAVMGMKALKQKGLLTALDESEEINACSININVDADGKNEEWLLMFKNETHNHPTEIEPFGGAATCLGGAIRDPLSGRAYVYQAMRVTGSADPRTPISETLPGKLPQKKITTGAAAGFSSYGNQIGLATGQVTEVYHPGFVAKRMELGAVLAAVPKCNVNRSRPEENDVVILVGGRTGRDGCGGATGSSKAHTEGSIESCGAEVQKGNSPTERKLQRLFRRTEVAGLIKRCNDFGAGGVSVAIGELADGLEIDLDAVPRKYDGLDGTELAISESQERMAVVVAPCDVDKFMSFSLDENLEATIVAKVTGTDRLVMRMKGESIVDISRDFLNTNGAPQSTTVRVGGSEKLDITKRSGKEKLYDALSDLNVCSQKGLCEMFDSTIGAGTVLMPFGGKHQLTTPEAMVAKIPVLKGKTNTVSLMAFGYDPYLSSKSPFHGAACAVVESISKIVASGGCGRNCYLSFQEFFERLGNDPDRWQKPFTALLGAFRAQMKLNAASIGGKDSMSGSFGDIDVPPVLVSFAVTSSKIENIISPEFKKEGSTVVRLTTGYDDCDLPDFNEFIKNCDLLHKLICDKKVISAHTIGIGGTAAALAKMSFGNKLGFDVVSENVYLEQYGSFLLEVPEWDDELFEGCNAEVIGKTGGKDLIINGEVYDIEEACNAWRTPLESIFPTDYVRGEKPKVREVELFISKSKIKSKQKAVKPKIFIPVFPGTNCEDDTARKFEEAGGDPQILVIKNLNMQMFNETIEEMVKMIRRSRIIAIPGGFSAGDEPEGSAKFISAVFRNPYVTEEVMKLLYTGDGLIIGICNGFQALLKLGLITEGKICEQTDDSPTLSFNAIGRHISCFARTKVISNKSPWLWNVNPGDCHMLPVSHGEGRFVINEAQMNELTGNGQIATQYVDFNGNPSGDIRFNPNGSAYAVEGATSPDGRVFGRMGHSDRVCEGLYKNIPEDNFSIYSSQKIFEAGVSYFD